MTREEMLAEKAKLENEILASGDVNLIRQHISPERLNELRSAEVERSANTINEMHPDIKFADRAIVKNFASSPETSLAYLQKQHPDMIIKNIDGTIKMRNKNENDYHVLDPSGFDMQDITDLGTDVGQGIAEGVGGVAAGVGTMNPFVGYGAMAGIGAGTEAIKQGVGSALGIPDNMNGANIAISGAASGLMPAIAQKVIAPAYNGLKNTVAPNVVGYLSGIHPEILKNINIDESARNLISATGMERFLDNKSQQVSQALQNQKNKLGQAVDGATGNSVDVSGVKNNIMQMLQGAQTKFLPNMQKQAASIGNEFDGVNSAISGEQARSLRDTMNSYAGNMDLPWSMRQIGESGRDGVKQALENSAPDKSVFNTANSEYSNYLDKLNSNLNLNSFVSKSAKTDESKKLDQLLLDNFKKYNADQRPAMNAKNEAYDFIKQAGVDDLPQTAREVSSYNYFDKPKILAKDFVTGAKAGTFGGSLGALMGYYGGGGATGGYGGAILGGLAGETMASPWAIKTGAGMVKGMENNAAAIGAKVNPYILKGAPKSIYNLMDGREN